MCKLMQECMEEKEKKPPNSEMVCLKICHRRTAVFRRAIFQAYTSQEKRVSLQSQIIYLVLLLLCGGPN